MKKAFVSVKMGNWINRKKTTCFLLCLLLGLNHLFSFPVVLSLASSNVSQFIPPIGHKYKYYYTTKSIDIEARFIKVVVVVTICFPDEASGAAPSEQYLGSVTLTGTTRSNRLMSDGNLARLIPQWSASEQATFWQGADEFMISQGYIPPYFISPNPLSDWMNVSLNGGFSDDLTVQLVSPTSGQQVLENRLPNTQNAVSIDVSALCPGIYTVLIKDAGLVVYTTSVVKR